MALETGEASCEIPLNLLEYSFTLSVAFSYDNIMYGPEYKDSVKFSPQASIIDSSLSEVLEDETLTNPELSVQLIDEIHAVE